MRTRRSYAFAPYRGTRGWILQNVVDRLFDQRCGGDKLSIALSVPLPMKSDCRESP